MLRDISYLKVLLKLLGVVGFVCIMTAIGASKDIYVEDDDKEVEEDDSKWD